MKQVTILIALLFSASALLAQDRNREDIPNAYRFNWRQAGSNQTVVTYTKALNIIDFEADNTGTISSNEPLKQAIASLNGKAGVIFFPEGNYFFDETISLTDSILIKGAGANQTNFTFNLEGKGNLIEAKGKAKRIDASLAHFAKIHTESVELESIEGIETGDYLKIGEKDGGVFSEWAEGSVAQILKVVGVNKDNNTLYFNTIISRNFGKNEAAQLHLINPVEAVGIECISIFREDETAAQTSHILFENAANSWVKNVESHKANFAHVNISNSTHIVVEGSYFTEGFSYGNGGKAYGVMLQFSSGDCLIQNNAFKKLRHAMILQAGANGNVIAYNYSTEAFWDGVKLPSNSAGDLVLHGNFVFANLMEGNVVQNIVIDDSHGKNGPYNAFYRNEAQLYGIFMNNSPATDSVVFVGNVVNNQQFLMGLYFLNGNGHFEKYNTVKGKILPANSEPLVERSLCFNYTPDYILNHNAEDINQGIIPAQRRFIDGIQISEGCTPPIVTSTEIAKDERVTTSIAIYPNPTNSYIQVVGMNTGIAKIYTLNGKLLVQQDIEKGNSIDVSAFEKGIYLVEISAENQREVVKLLIN